MNPDPLKTALGASRPIPTDREELEIERLLTPDQKRLTVEEHFAWRKSLEPQPEGEEL